MSHSIQDYLLQHSKTLQATLGIEPSTSRIEVQCLLQEVLHVNRAYLYAHAEQVLNAVQDSAYMGLLKRRMQGEPIAYILGKREFFGLDLKVSPATLIPRPDTELLVEQALQHIPAGQPCAVLDLGTGTGAIALSIAHARPQTQVLAVDASEAALQVARENKLALGLSNVSLLLSDWFGALEGLRFDVIVSNPPYIRSDDVHLSQGDVRFEPMTALASGVDGLRDIRQICSMSMQFLIPGGCLMLEHGYDQAKAVQDIMSAAGFRKVYTERDLAGVERVTGGYA